MKHIHHVIFAAAVCHLPGCNVIKDDKSSTERKQCVNPVEKKETPAGATLLAASDKISDAVPFQKWEKLGATTEGLLFASGSQAWGGSFDHGGLISEGETRKEYKFAANGFSPYALYFLSSGEGTNFIKNWSVDTGSGKMTFNAAMFDPTTKNLLGLSKAAHLVRLGVNSGKGGGGGVHFVATTASVIDGTPDAPLSPVTAITDAKNRFETYLVANASTRESTLKTALADLVKKYPDAPPEATAYSIKTFKGIAPSWSAAAKQLQVVYIEKTTADFSKTVKNDQIFICPDNAPCAKPEPTINIAYHYEARLGVTYIYDNSGVLVSETALKTDSTFNQNNRNIENEHNQVNDGVNDVKVNNVDDWMTDKNRVNDEIADKNCK